MYNIVGIIGAMEEEVQTLKDAMVDISVSTHAGTEFVKGMLCGQSVVLVRCGVGKVNAAICTQVLISVFGVEAIVNTGVAGALDSRLCIGDVVVSNKFVHHDMDVRPLGYRLGQIPFMNVHMFPADRRLVDCAVSAAHLQAPGVQVLVGPVATGDQFIATNNQKAHLVDEFGAYCAEMEGAAAAQTCYLSGIPFVGIRCMSDQADGAGPESYEEFEVEMSHRCAGITMRMMEQEAEHGRHS